MSYRWEKGDKKLLAFHVSNSVLAAGQNKQNPSGTSTWICPQCRTIYSDLQELKRQYSKQKEEQKRAKAACVRARKDARKEADLQRCSRNQRQPFRALFVKAVDEIPEFCPNDSHPIMSLRTVYRNKKAFSAYVCTFCKTLFIRTLYGEILRLPDTPPFVGKFSAPLFVIKFSLGRKEKYLTVIENHKQQNIEQGIYCIDDPLATQAMIAVLQKAMVLHLNDVDIPIGQVRRTQHFIDHEKQFLHFYGTSEPLPIYVFPGKYVFGKDIERVIALVFFPQVSRYIPLKVYWSSREDRYYVDRAILNGMKARYGPPMLNPIDAQSLVYPSVDQAEKGNGSPAVTDTQSAKIYPDWMRDLPSFLDKQRLTGLPDLLFTVELLPKGLGPKYMFVVDGSTKESTRQGIFRIKKSNIAAEALTAVLKGGTSLRYAGCDIPIGQVWKTRRFIGDEKRSLHFYASNKPLPIYVFSGKYAYERDTECVTALVYFPKTTGYVALTVYYSPKEDKYYVNQDALNDMTARYGVPVLQIVQAPQNSEKTDRDAFDQMAQGSELWDLGYSVSADSPLSEEERHALLASIIDQKQMEKADIAKHIGRLIAMHTGDPRYRNACKKWRQDRLFVLNYKAASQRTIHGVLRRKK